MLVQLPDRFVAALVGVAVALVPLEAGAPWWVPVVTFLAVSLVAGVAVERARGSAAGHGPHGRGA
jgi:membrane protein implicated in regulation of membrane protease activity